MCKNSYEYLAKKMGQQKKSFLHLHKQAILRCLRKCLGKNHEDADYFVTLADNLKELAHSPIKFSAQMQDHALRAIIIVEEMPFIISTLQNIDPKPDFSHFERIEIGGIKAPLLVFIMKWERTDFSASDLMSHVSHRVRFNLLAVSDRDAYLTHTQSIIESIADLDTRSFLNWLASDHFTYLGYTNYGQKLLPNLGFFRDNDFSLQSLLPEQQFNKLRNYLEETSEPIIFLKSSIMSPVHRHVPLDIVFIRSQKPQNFFCFVGLYTAIAYSTAKQAIPVVGPKILKALKTLKIKAQSYEGKVMRHLADTLPYDEVLQSSVTSLSVILKRIYEHHTNDRFGSIVFTDPINRYTNIILYIPNKSFDTNKFVRAQRVTEDITQANLSLVNAILDFTSYGLVHYRTYSELSTDVIKKIDQSLSPIFEDWLKNFANRLKSSPQHPYYQLALHDYNGLYTTKYQMNTSVDQAIFDIAYVHECVTKKHREVRFYFDTQKHLHIRIFNPHEFLILSDAFVSLDNFGLRVLTESSYTFKTTQGMNVWIHDMRVDIKDAFMHTRQLKKIMWGRVVEALQKLWCGHLEDAYFNSLVTTENVSWKDVILHKALAHYLRQIGLGLQINDLQFLLENYHRFFAHVSALFNILHDPAIELTQDERHAQADHMIRLCESYLFSVVDSEDERWLRCLLETTRAIVRTNFFTTAFTDSALPRIAIKLDTKKIKESPEPKPFKEIFVYTSAFEGVHLRSAAVARGGIRWSDRREDYRTEILGLLAAQIVKNSIIIPAGAKGGFVLKKSPKQFDSPEEYRDFAINSYKQFIQSLLDITDNIPHQSATYLSYDGQDPYLVVAADKGTASFSDHANEVSQKNQFWLGDAFASGGKYGYSHKDLGITAKGAWESAKHHFMQKGIDIQQESIKVVGVGDMSGDVFGNGMLCSDKLLLVAAFDHRHIFIDPNPTADTSFQERSRLFALPKSSWNDYDKKLISKGGGVFSRQDRKIKITPQMREIFEIPATHTVLSANQLIHFILSSPVDLLWFGGIGTFVCASHEDAFGVKDPVNNAIRVKARDLRCRVIVEGANLGVTHAARMEFAALGGVINTDSIDNSAGVNCSDYEVNIKILFQELINNKKMTLSQRNQMLETVRGEVVTLILQNNILQNQLLTNMQNNLRSNPDDTSLVTFLKQNNLISTDALNAQDARHVSSRPELCLMISHVKNFLTEKLLLSQLCEHKVFEGLLLGYFPQSLSRKYADTVLKHPLRKNIIATTLANKIVNVMGADFPVRLQNATNAQWPQLVCLWYSFTTCLPHCTFDSLSNKEKEFVYAILSFLLRSLPHNFQEFTYTPQTNGKGKHLLWQQSLMWANQFVPTTASIKEILGFITEHKWDEVLLEILPEGHENETERTILGNLFDEILTNLFAYIQKQSKESPACHIHEKTLARFQTESFTHKIELAQNFLKILRL